VLNSDYRQLCRVSLPYQGRQKYMHTFDLSAPVMPEGFEDYLELVTALCRAAGAIRGEAHMTVDEKIVAAGRSQRRPKPHVDGCFIPAKMDWSHDGRWAHTCNNVAESVPRRMSVIVAASVQGCRAWQGVFDGAPAGDGDLSHIADKLGDGEVLAAGVGYLLSPDCIHESMIFAAPTERSFLRIALPVEFADAAHRQ
jgi:hypothetical protein